MQGHDRVDRLFTLNTTHTNLTGPVWPNPTENLGSKAWENRGKADSRPKFSIPQSKTEVDGREEAERRGPLRPGDV